MLRDCLPRFAQKTDGEILRSKLTLHDAQHAMARQYGFVHWAALSAAVDERSKNELPASVRPRLSALKNIDDKLRRHIETLGFHSIGAYRIWCHKEGLDSSLDKSDALLYEELLRHRQTPPRPAPRRDYRPAEARKITQAYTGADEGLWNGWKKPFDGVDDPAERAALHRLLIHCIQYAPIGGPLVWQLARHHRDWQHPVEEWIPKGHNEKELLVELTRFLLGRDELPLADDPRLQRGERPSVCYAQIKTKRDTILSPAEVEQYEELGYVHVKEAFPREAALEIRDFMWSELERLYGFKCDEPSTWHKDGWDRDRRGFQWTELKLNRSKDHPIYQNIAAPRLMQAIEELIGPREISLKQSWGAFRPVFPSLAAAPWDVPEYWNFYGHPRLPWLLGVTTFYSDVPPQSGGRLVVEGSHHLARTYFDRLKPSELIERGLRVRGNFFKQCDYFAQLLGKGPAIENRVRYFMENKTQVDGIDLRVVELTGEPGDAIFSNGWLVGSSVSRNVMGEPTFARG